MVPQDVILTPIRTEKGFNKLGEKVYQFKVSSSANKFEIKQAVEIIFNVHVTKVNTINVRGKAVRRGVHHGFTPSWKKAIVSINPDESIAFFEGLA
ncbi:50S ribosomal protein L23 [bacterium]|nr:50S ribosomal protein L23 [bacterium]